MSTTYHWLLVYFGPTLWLASHHTHYNMTAICQCHLAGCLFTWVLVHLFTLLLPHLAGVIFTRHNYKLVNFAPPIILLAHQSKYSVSAPLSRIFSLNHSFFAGFGHPVPGGFLIHNYTSPPCIVCYQYFPTQNPCSHLVPYNTSSFRYRQSITGHMAGQLKIGGPQVNHSFYWAGVFYIIAGWMFKKWPVSICRT